MSKYFLRTFFFNLICYMVLVVAMVIFHSYYQKKYRQSYEFPKKKNWVRLGMILTRYITHCLTRFDPSNFGLWWVLTRLLSIHPNLTQLAQLPPLSEMRLWKKQGKSNKIIIFTWETIWCLCSYLLLFWVLPRSSLTEI